MYTLYPEALAGLAEVALCVQKTWVEVTQDPTGKNHKTCHGLLTARRNWLCSACGRDTVLGHHIAAL